MVSALSTQPHHSAVVRHRQSQADFLPAMKRIVWTLIISAAVLIAGFTFYPEWIRLNEMKLHLAKQKAELQQSQNHTQQWEQEVHFLQTDRDYLETIARDRLDMMKEGETIFRLSGNTHQHS
jgi:cell division protein FtsB